MRWQRVMMHVIGILAFSNAAIRAQTASPSPSRSADGPNFDANK